MNEPKKEPVIKPRELTRLDMGEAWMMCHDCGAKLWSFDGCKDTSRGCPYLTRQGKCEPGEKR